MKLEGGVEQAETIAALVRAGIPVMAHCGLRPQSVHTLGGYKVQRDEAELMADAKAAEQDAELLRSCSNAFPANWPRKSPEHFDSDDRNRGGADCDGQVLVLHDLLGITSGYMPRFVKAYADLKTEITGAVAQYREEVRDGTFPAKEHGYE